jgi:hypothetical protein
MDEFVFMQEMLNGLVGHPLSYTRRNFLVLGGKRRYCRFANTKCNAGKAAYRL